MGQEQRQEKAVMRTSGKYFYVLGVNESHFKRTRRECCAMTEYDVDLTKSPLLNQSDQRLSHNTDSD